MVYIYLPAAYYQLNLDVTKENLLATRFSAVPEVFLVYNFFFSNFAAYHGIYLNLLSLY